MPDEPRLPGRLAALARGLRRIFGMPDYQAYVGHLRRCHPGAPVPSEGEYFEAYLAARYGNGPSRCC